MQKIINSNDEFCCFEIKKSFLKFVIVSLTLLFYITSLKILFKT